MNVLTRIDIYIWHLQCLIDPSISIASGVVHNTRMTSTVEVYISVVWWANKQIDSARITLETVGQTLFLACRFNFQYKSVLTKSTSVWLCAVCCVCWCFCLSACLSVVLHSRYVSLFATFLLIFQV